MSGLVYRNAEELMETKPILIHPGVGDGAVATALSEPSITLVEGGPAIGVLVAESCHEDSYSGRLFLDRVTWARGDEAVRALRDFGRVCLSRAEHGFWIAEEIGTGRLFPRPSRLPYRVVFIPQDNYEELMRHRAVGDAEAILADARSRFAGLPGFRLRERSLVCPEGYAAEENATPEGKSI
jgi:hypothetical protein